MTKDEIFQSVKNEINYSETTKLPMNPSYTLGEQHRLELIDRYMNSRYRDGDTDSLGQPMVFYNISSFPVDVASKMMDFDTKDIMLLAEDEHYWQTWLMEKELRFWMKDRYFGRQLNDWAYMTPRDGDIFLKKVDHDVQVVPLKNLRFRPDALSLEETPIVEKYEYMADHFVKEAKDRGWDDWQKVELNPDKVQNGYFDKSGNKVKVYGAWFPQGFLETEDNYFILSYDGHILASWEEDLFYKHHSWEKVNGRLLGKGVVEKLFNEQIYLNRIANYKADGLNWTSKHFFQTRDQNFKNNLLGDSDNGDVFTTNDPIDPVLMEERNLGFYVNEEGRWEQQAMRRVFTQESITGERAPAGTPLGSSILNARMTAGFYDQKKEDLAMFVKEVLWDWVLPEFKKEKRQGHSVVMRALLESDEGSQKFFQLQLQTVMNKKKLGSKWLPPEMWKMREALEAEKLKGSKMEIPRGFYDNLKAKMEITIVGESIDTASKLTSLQTLFQIIGSNPSVMENPTTQKILFKMLSMAGFNPKDFETEETPTLQGALGEIRAQRGGSIAAPRPTAVPAQLPETIAA